MVKYSNGKIYKIEALNGKEGDIYIGSTTKEYLSQRMDTHRGGYKNWLKNGKNGDLTRSYIIFEKYGIENCTITLLELVNAKCRDELLQREKHYIRSLNCINNNLPIVTKDDVQERKKVYHRLNKEYFNELASKNYKDKKEAILLSKKLYYEHNKDIICTKHKCSGKITCECGSIYRKCDKSQHEKTKKHLKYLDSINGRSTTTTEIIL
jgi:hypothetical protein